MRIMAFVRLAVRGVTGLTAGVTEMVLYTWTVAFEHDRATY